MSHRNQHNKTIKLIFFQLLGCAILGVGIWVRVDPNFKQYVDNSESFNYLYACAYILIVVGVIVMVVGFLGCCGAIRESQCMLSMVSNQFTVSQYSLPVFERWQCVIPNRVFN